MDSAEPRTETVVMGGWTVNITAPREGIGKWGVIGAEVTIFEKRDGVPFPVEIKLSTST